jgi:phage terminase small subunit
MPALSNPRHERFARWFMRTGNASRAYELAGFKPARPNAHRLKTNENVQRRIAELRRYAGRQSGVSATSLIQDLDESRRLALELGQAAAAVAAVVAKAKICGLWVKKSEKGEPGAFDREGALDLIEQQHGTEVRRLLEEALAK